MPPPARNPRFLVVASPPETSVSFSKVLAEAGEDSGDGQVVGGVDVCPSALTTQEHGQQQGSQSRAG